jgi:hypothetical protein
MANYEDLDKKIAISMSLGEKKPFMNFPKFFYFHGNLPIFSKNFL